MCLNIEIPWSRRIPFPQRNGGQTIKQNIGRTWILINIGPDPYRVRTQISHRRNGLELSCESFDIYWSRNIISALPIKHRVRHFRRRECYCLWRPPISRPAEIYTAWHLNLFGSERNLSTVKWQAPKSGAETLIKQNGKHIGSAEDLYHFGGSDQRNRRWTRSRNNIQNSWMGRRVHVPSEDWDYCLQRVPIYIGPETNIEGSLKEHRVRSSLEVRPYEFYYGCEIRTAEFMKAAI